MRLSLIYFLILFIASFSLKAIDCDGIDKSLYSAEYKFCLRASIADEANIDCIECLVQEEQQGTTLGGVIDTLAMPLTILGTTYISAKYAHRTQERWADAYESGFKECTNRFNSYLDYNLERGASPVLATQAERLLDCNGHHYHDYAGYRGYVGDGFGGHHHPWHAAGYGPDFLAGMHGPNFHGHGGIGGHGHGGVHGGAYGQFNVNPAALLLGLIPNVSAGININGHIGAGFPGGIYGSGIAGGIHGGIGGPGGIHGGIGGPGGIHGGIGGPGGIHGGIGGPGGIHGGIGGPGGIHGGISGGTGIHGGFGGNSGIGGGGGYTTDVYGNVYDLNGNLVYRGNGSGGMHNAATGGINGNQDYQAYLQWVNDRRRQQQEEARRRAEEEYRRRMEERRRIEEERRRIEEERRRKLEEQRRVMQADASFNSYLGTGNQQTHRDSLTNLQDDLRRSQDNFNYYSSGGSSSYSAGNLTNSFGLGGSIGANYTVGF